MLGPESRFRTIWYISFVLMLLSAVFGEGIFIVGLLLFLGCSFMNIIGYIIVIKARPIARQDFRNFAQEKRITESHARAIIHAYTEHLCPISLEEEDKIIKTAILKGKISKYFLMRSILDYLEENKRGSKKIWLKMLGFNSMENVKDFLENP